MSLNTFCHLTIIIQRVYTKYMTNLKDYINDFGRTIQELEARQDLTPQEYEDKYDEALEETMQNIINRLIGGEV
jgi:hypothetical protein